MGTVVRYMGWGWKKSYWAWGGMGLIFTALSLFSRDGHLRPFSCCNIDLWREVQGSYVPGKLLEYSWNLDPPGYIPGTL